MAGKKYLEIRMNNIASDENVYEIGTEVMSKWS